MDSRAFFADHLEDFLSELRQLVEIETPTGYLPGLESAARFLAPLFAPFGELVEENLDGWGPLLRLRRPGVGSSVLLAAHYDTVWPLGSWPRPWQRDGDLVRGPGVYDMKAGLLFILWLLRWLDRSGVDHPSLEILLTPDEEVGAVASAPAIHAAARRCHFALITEPTVADGGIKVARKGSGEFRLTVAGRTAHQGVEPELGANAVVECAHQVLALRALEDPGLGTTVGPNVIHGGTVSNAVPDRCEVRVDVRAWTAAETERISSALAGLRPVDPTTSLSLSGGWNRPPMEATPASMELFERARRIGAEHGMEIGSLRWGGSSDANLTASSGTPTLDGLGPVGAGSHHPQEHIVISRLSERMALLAELVASLAEPPERWLSPAAVAGLETGDRTASSVPEQGGS